MKKIMVIGSGGSGKSELSRRLSEILGIEVFHLDRLHWRPDWVEPPKEEWIETVENLVNRNSWIIDGNYSGTMEIRAEAADTIIFLDMPRTLCVWRAVKRWSTHRNSSRPDMAEGCNEKIDSEFVKWIWQFPSVSKPKIEEMLRRYSDKKLIYVLESRHHVETFVQQLQQSSA